MGDEAEEGDGFEGEVCYSITHKMQFNVTAKSFPRKVI